MQIIFFLATTTTTTTKSAHTSGVHPRPLNPKLHPLEFLQAAGGGFEPPFSIPETDVLPLDDPAV